MPIDSRELAFQTWAPPGAAWSPWAKPVMFANAPIDIEDAALPQVDIDPALFPAADGKTAIVVDLPAVRSISVGLLAATVGYRPVPLLNAVPWPEASAGFLGGPAVHGLWSAAKLLMASVDLLADLNLPNDAPPVFLLDSNRRGSALTVIGEGDFDNRSVSLTTDFPSATLLAGAGIRDVVLITAGVVAADELAHTLRRWQEANNPALRLSIFNSDTPLATPKALRVAKPRAYRLMFQRWLAVLGLRRSPFGGFGATLPIHYSGGG